MWEVEEEEEGEIRSVENLFIYCYVFIAPCACCGVLQAICFLLCVCLSVSLLN